MSRLTRAASSVLHEETSSRQSVDLLGRTVGCDVIVQTLFRLTGSKELGRYATHELAMVVRVTVAARESIVGPDVSLKSREGD